MIGGVHGGKPVHAHGPFCPHCGSDLDGGPIPERLHAHYSPPYRWQRTIGLSDGDSVYVWKCPDCGHEWLRGEAYRARAERAGWTEIIYQ